MDIEEDKAGSVYDVLTYEVFQEVGLSGTREADDPEVRGTCSLRENNEFLAVAEERGSQNKIAALESRSSWTRSEKSVEEGLKTHERLGEGT